MTRDEYWYEIHETVERVVESAKDAIREGDIDSNNEVHNHLVEAIDEALDGASHGDCNEVMQYTNNPDAVHDVGPDFSGKSLRQICDDFAYWAWRQDHYDAMPDYSDYEEWIEELAPQEEEDEDEEYEEPEPSPVPQKTEKERMIDFFKPKKRNGDGFFGLSSFERGRRRR